MRAFSIACAAGIMGASGFAAAHHSVGAIFDVSQVIEAEGEVTEILWRNPHVQITIVSVDADGNDQTWDIEGNSVSNVSRLGLTVDLVPVGTRVRVAGNPGRVRDNFMWLRNILLPGQEEILFVAGAEPRWSGETIGADVRSAVATDPSGELGIFRVWTSATSPPQFWGNDFPLTPSARRTRAEFDPIADDPTIDCAPKGMPYVMEQPYPIEFVDAGNVIEMRLEEYDTVRRILMSADAQVQAPAPGILGRSVGRWDDDVLVVETSGIDYPWLNGRGIPLSEHARIQERFEVSGDGSRLQYAMKFTDPLVFTEIVTFTKTWEWRPGEEVRPYDCISQ